MFDTPIGTAQLVFLGVALVVACGFEFVNGFHDTANAVATVIYTRSLRPWYAVILSGTCNFLGVYLGGIAVAMGILKLLPVDLLASSGSGAGLAMVLSLLLAAILWNLGTWYFGLPASSSHTLIGAIVGVGLANSLMPGHVFGSGVNWHKVQEIGTSLIVSPLFGLTAAALLMLLARKVLASPKLHSAPDPTKPPPWWIRGILVTTCSGVSFAHGSNDGQKGVGLIMLILIGLLPADFAVDRAMGHDKIAALVSSTDRIEMVAQNLGSQPMIAGGAAAAGKTAPPDLETDLEEIRATLSGRDSLRDVPPDRRFDLRARILRVDAQLGNIEKTSGAALQPEQWASLKKERAALRGAIDYAPSWVLIVVALSLGLGTMIGWKRIVTTVGEKIGKTHLTYSQGASAEIVAMTTIGLSSWFGLPVSTTHVLSSGIAGTMMANKSGLQKSTVRNIALAWVLTLPVAMVLGGLLFLGFRAVLPGGSAPTPGVHFAPHDSDEQAIVVPLDEQPLRLHGSNTIGAELAPALAEAFLTGRGATDVHRDKDVGGHAWVVSGTLPNEHKPLAIEIDASGSETAFDDLAAGKADLGLSSRPVTAAEADKLRGAGAGDATEQGNENVIGLDGVAVVVNAANQSGPVSVDTLARIFTGAATAWPGNNAPIHVYARDDRSGTYATFKGVVLGDRPLAPTAARFADSAALEAAVANDPGGIGFVAMAYVHKTRALAVSDTGADAVSPTTFSVATEDYPITRRLFLYAPAPRRHRLSQDFVAFALSPQGQTIVAGKGFVDLRASAADPAPCAGCPAAYANATKGSKRMSLDFRFDTGATALDARGQRDLDRLVAYLRTMRSPSVTLLGFSDAAGDDQANAELSRSRAKRIADALTARGVGVSTVDGLGEQMPVASNDTPQGRERNRRVEVWVSGS
jgi:PiT family inorganic phosphate transporter